MKCRSIVTVTWCLNAPFGARCFLTPWVAHAPSTTPTGLNTPYGTDLGGLLENVACNSASTPSRLEAVPLRCCGFRCSLKFELGELHAKFSGARCFLTIFKWVSENRDNLALMHLMVLSTFWCRCRSLVRSPLSGLNAPFGARCFLTCYWLARDVFGYGES